MIRKKEKKTSCFSGKWIYERTTDNSSRYVLGQEGTRPLVCFGVNSSTAEPDDLDPTLTLVRNRAFENGFDSWIMLNLYPQRATLPNDMHEQVDKKIYQENLKWIKRIFKQNPNAVVWAAWGGIITKRKYLSESIRNIVPLVPKSAKWVKKGKLVGGIHPHHPLYLKKDLPFDDFDIHEYVENL